MRIWSVMDDCIRTGVASTEPTLPGRLRLRRRAPALYRRLMRGFYPGISVPQSSGPAIGGPGMASGALSGPDGAGGAVTSAPMNGNGNGAAFTALENDYENGNGNGNGNGGSRLGKSRPRPARVVGSFDHAVLPMPPVCSLAFNAKRLSSHLQL